MTGSWSMLTGPNAETVGRKLKPIVKASEQGLRAQQGGCRRVALPFLCQRLETLGPEAQKQLCLKVENFCYSHCFQIKQALKKLSLVFTL